MDNNQISYEEIDREIEARATNRRRRLPHDIFDFSELILIVIAVLLLLSAFLVRQTVVSGGSMQPTLEHGERLLISNLLYTPKAGDIVVLQVEEEIAERFPSSLYKHEPIIKRVIATEGQTVSITDGTVYIDGEPLEEEYKSKPGPYSHPDERANMAPVKISEGHIFVMGDNRGNSLDSRWFGEVDERTVIGKVILRFYPFPAFGGVN